MIVFLVVMPAVLVVVTVDIVVSLAFTQILAEVTVLVPACLLLFL